MKQLILTIGCPGSGKSTWAEEYARTHPGFYVVNRDNIRIGLMGITARNEYKYSKAREKLVTEIARDQVLTIMSKEGTKGVIVADTNLNEARRVDFETYAEANGWRYSEQVFDVPWTELLKRNLYRGEGAVPIDVLRGMYAKMHPRRYVADEKLPKAVIFDLDGTLADNDHRSPYDLSLCHKDGPKEMVILLLKMLREKGYKIITVSGRESGTVEDMTVFRRMTQKWVLDHVGETHEHYQRAQGDARKDDIVKEEIFFDHIASRFNVKLAVDDRAQVCEMWRRLGLECWQVAHGDF